MVNKSAKYKITKMRKEILLFVILFPWEGNVRELKAAIEEASRRDFAPMLEFAWRKDIEYPRFAGPHAMIDIIKIDDLLKIDLHDFLEWGKPFLKSEKPEAVSDAPVSRPTASSVDSTDQGTQPSPIEGNVFRKKGDSWYICYEGREFRPNRDYEGLKYIACLLRNEGQEIHVLGLVRMVKKQPTSRSVRRYGAMSEEQLSEYGLSISSLDDGELVSDKLTISECKRRLDDLKEQLREAEEFNDIGQVDRLKEEIESITDYLAAAHGLDGRIRTTAHPAEKARKSISKNTKLAMDKIQIQHPSLWQHLYNAGIGHSRNYCYSYTPERPANWVL